MHLVSIHQSSARIIDRHNTNSTLTTIPEAPWSLSKVKIKIADKSASSIEYPKGFDYTPADHFTRQWTLRILKATTITAAEHRQEIKKAVTVIKKKSEEVMKDDGNDVTNFLSSGNSFHQYHRDRMTGLF
ncbi:Hypothetical predicted protein [Mytilus galloprovincialis]|uniref:Uncharacterized protein n=1 Tax=Mytilus galloprovincialis TaxID=29158 RepID=A0A8B6G8C7_MYTGA|nr:Hypothetical predicted protein [Mytilus galloprovincialis]